MIHFQRNFLLIAFLFIAVSMQAASVSYPFRHLGIEQGLSKSGITSIIQDETGFMWIGTYDGLNRYDGYQFRIFRPEADNAASLSDNYIQCLLQDVKQKIWIGTKKGLDFYDPLTETFQRIQLDPDQSAIEITTLCQDSRNRLWIGTTQGICILDSTLKPQWLGQLTNTKTKLATGWIFSIHQDRKDYIRVSVENEFYGINPDNILIKDIQFTGQENNVRVRCFNENANGTLFLGSDNGLWQIDPETGNCIRPLQKGLQQPALINTSIYSLFTDNSGKLWIGTWGAGLLQYDPESDVLEIIRDSNLPQGMQFIYQIFQDRTNEIWIGSKTGIFLYDPFAKPFYAYTNQGSGYKHIDLDITKSIVQDAYNSDVIWANTDRGLCRVELESGKYTKFSDRPELKNHFIHSLYMEPNGLLWIGTNGELISFDTQKNIWNTYPQIRHPDPRVTLLSYFAIQRDWAGILWLGTYEHGLIRFDPATKDVLFFVNDPIDSTSLPDNHIWALYQDRQRRLWIGTDKGFALFNKNNGTFTTWYNQNDQTPSLISNRVRVISQDHENQLWIGTDGGLCRFGPETGIIQCYSEKDGMPNNVVHGILEETRADNNNWAIWISTNRGILKFDPLLSEWTSYLMQDGVHHTEFSRQSYCKLRDNRMVFGGINGFTLFKPAQFAINPFPPRVAFTDFQLFYQSVTPGVPFMGKIVLPQSITHTGHIILSRKHEIFSVEFTTFHFAQNDKIRYMYRLEGFNKDWFNAKGSRSATFTNLAPGKYTLHVRAISADDVWSEKDAELIIIMQPSFWQRKLVKAGLVMLLLAGLFIFYKNRTHRIHKRNILLEQFNTQLQHEIHERIQAEASLLKTQNQLTSSLKEKEILLRELYHRTKNNMQVISSMIRLHSKVVKNKQMKNLLQEIQNKIMAMALVHQKLYESNDLSHLNLTDYIKSLVTYVKTQPNLHTEKLSFSVEGEEILVLIDTAIPCGLIINELIINSIKYAFPNKEKGEIKIKLHLNNKKELLITVADNGVGLPANFDFQKDIHLGLESVIEIVKHQLQGTINFKNKNGLICQIHLKEELYKPRI